MTDEEEAEFLRSDVQEVQGSNETQGSNGSALMTQEDAIKRFVLAGNAYFTLVSQRTGVRFTYRVSKSKPNPAYPQNGDTYFVSVLTGPDNWSNYSYAGLLQEMGGLGWGVRQTRGSKISPNNPGYRGVVWFLGRVLNGRPAESVEFYHAGKCGRCGRMLTVPESIQVGLGPECAGRF
jgi:hypothetical protein